MGSIIKGRRLLAIAALSVFTGASAQAAEVVKAPNLSAALAAPVDAVVAFVDPDGNLRDPSAVEVDGLMQRARALPHEGHLPQVQAFMMKNGTIAVKLPPEYMMKSVVERGEDGELHYSHGTIGEVK